VDNDTSSVSIVIAIPPGLPNLPRPLDPAFLPSIQHCPRRQTTTCTPPSRRTQTVGRGIPGSGKAHRSTACGADAPRCVRSPPCPIHPRAFTARNDARQPTREERERDSSRQTPLINTRHPPHLPRISSRSSLDRAREFRRSE